VHLLCAQHMAIKLSSVWWRPNRTDGVSKLPHACTAHNKVPLFSTPCLPQREANYLRYLLTTPLDKRPSFIRSAGRCSFADPSYCSMPAQTPAQALSLLKTQLQETCSVTDGVRDLDLTTESASAGQ
jgi:hypothetical protein